MPRAMQILLVEDNPADVDLAMKALKKGNQTNTLEIVEDGEQAMAFLLQQGDYKKAPRPDLILLDLNLPRKNGREVLAELKEHPDLRRIPVVVLTTSQADEDVLASYNLHCNSYITKPVEVTDFMRVIRQLEDYWQEVVRLPPC